MWKNQRPREADGGCLPGDQKEHSTQQLKVKRASENQNNSHLFSITNFSFKTFWYVKDRCIQFSKSVSLPRFLN